MGFEPLSHARWGNSSSSASGWTTRRGSRFADSMRRNRPASCKIPTRIVHGVSILTAAAGALGLQIYKFGRTTTVPFSSAGFAPTSPLEAILTNRRAGLHSLVLLDLREDGSFLAPRDAIAS